MQGASDEVESTVGVTAPTGGVTATTWVPRAVVNPARVIVQLPRGGLHQPGRGGLHQPPARGGLHQPPARGDLHQPPARPLHQPPARPLHQPPAGPLHQPPAGPLHQPLTAIPDQSEACPDSRFKVSAY